MDRPLTWTDCDEAGDYVVPNVLSPRDLVSRPDNMDKIVPHIRQYLFYRKIGTERSVLQELCHFVILSFCPHFKVFDV